MVKKLIQVTKSQIPFILSLLSSQTSQAHNFCKGTLAKKPQKRGKTNVSATYGGSLQCHKLKN